MESFEAPERRPFRREVFAGIAVLVALAAGYAFLVATAYKNAALHQWDESRQAMNALMMAENGHWLVTYFHDAPDMWNTKPPLLIWFMVLSLKIFGYADWALRLPVGIAGGLTVLLVAGYCWFRLRSPLAAFASGVVLLSSYGFMGMHGATTADYDVPLALLITGSAFAFHHWVESNDRRMLPLVALGFALAVLVKSVAGLMVLPGLLLYALLRGRAIALFRSPWMWLSALGAIALVVAYYLAREQVNPGYVAAVIQNELTGRYLEVIENHAHGPAFYLKSMWGEPEELHLMWPGSGRYMPWIFAVPILWVLALASRSENARRLALFATSYSLPFLAVISSAQTKLFWYDIPLYPMLALLAGIGLLEARNRCSALSRRFGARRVGALVVVGAFLWVGEQAFDITHQRLGNWHSQNEAIRDYMQRLRAERPELHFTSFHRDGIAPYHFYVLGGSLEAQRARGTNHPTLDASAVVVCDTERRQKAEREYRTQVVHGGEDGNPCVTLALLEAAPMADAGTP